ncbi:Glyco_tran_10_N domain-containing protein [Meloidogyne graminicola]|uniref:Fucosyltransferase n=1 Tax=Meloidogyne graminicola TaxID=189291 RepID=A0A8S9ZK24_9BILA|nr:Glyco_tran_10_N domain-containing protein [Meloidogyne graminicola]
MEFLNFFKILIFFLLLILFYFIYYKQESENYIFKLSKEEEKQEMPPILIWNKCIRQDVPKGIGYIDYPVVVPDNDKCEYNCTFTYDRTLEVNASTIIFFIHRFCLPNEWPKNRREDQNFMMYTVECPAETAQYFDQKLPIYEWINSSATYRLDSSVFMPYDALTKITSETPKEYILEQDYILEKIKNKTKFAFQAVTHCNAFSNRDLLTEKLRQLIEVNVVGKCFDKIECNNECYEHELNQHFFYLAFENSICHQYVTEKFWYSLRALTVPIVLRRSVFKGMDIPPNSFIAVDDFLSINELVEHLKALKNNIKEYLKYFEWTKTYTNRKYGLDYSTTCKICEFATKHFNKKTKSIINLNEFWNEKDCNKDNFVKNFLKL